MRNTNASTSFRTGVMRLGESVKMPGYRLYLLDIYSGHIEGVEEIHSADDLGAIALVTEKARHVPAELWCGGRKVCRFDALPEIATYAGPSRKRVGRLRS